MQSKTVYKVEIDGVMLYEEYPTPEKAMDGARLYFAKDHSKYRAEIIKYVTLDMGIVMYNKDYEKPSELNVQK